MTTEPLQHVTSPAVLLRVRLCRMRVRSWHRLPGLTTTTAAAALACVAPGVAGR